MKPLLKFGLLALLSSCASRGGALTVDTEPSAAAVYSPSQDLLGNTPLELTSEQIEKIRSESQSSGEVSLTLRKEGFETLQVFVEPKAFDKLSLKLAPKTQETFRSQIVKDYASDAHAMLSQYLRTQGYLGARQLVQAKPLVDELLRSYPDIAATYVLAADYSLMSGDRAQARIHILKASQLAPQDGDVKRTLRKVGLAP